MRKGTSPLVEQLFDVSSICIYCVVFKLHMTVYTKRVYEKDCNACLRPYLATCTLHSTLIQRKNISSRRAVILYHIAEYFSSGFNVL